MKFVCHSNWNHLPESANALFETAAKDSIFFSHQWFENLTTTLSDEQTFVLACVETENKVLAMLPLITSAGTTGYSLKHRYTPHYSLLLADGAHEQVVTCLVQGLSQLPLNALLLEPVASNDRNLDALQWIMEAAGFKADRSFRFYNWILRLNEQSFEDYMASRPARLRNTITRKERKLEREHGYEIRLFTGDEVPQKMPDYYAVYRSSWKANEQYVNFMDGMVVGFSKPGWTRLGVLYVNEQPIAAQLWFVLHGKASIFRLSYNEAWKQYSPGSILTRFLMEYVIDTDKVKEIDFLVGNESYKQDWMSERREFYAWSCVKSVKPAGRLELFVGSMKRMLKSILRNK